MSNGEENKVETESEVEYDVMDLVIAPRDAIGELADVASRLMDLMKNVKSGLQADSGDEGDIQVRLAFKEFKNKSNGWEEVIAKLRAIRADGKSPKEETETTPAPELVPEPTSKESLEIGMLDSIRQLTSQVIAAMLTPKDQEVQKKIIETQKDMTETLRHICVTLGAPKCMTFTSKNPVTFEYYPFAGSEVPGPASREVRPLHEYLKTHEVGVQIGTPAKDLKHDLQQGKEQGDGGKGQGEGGKGPRGKRSLAPEPGTGDDVPEKKKRANSKHK